jgi:hypothetical protein
MVTDQQVRRLFKLMQTETTGYIAAAKAGMDEKTARKYMDAGKLPSELLIEDTRPETIWTSVSSHFRCLDPKNSAASSILLVYPRHREVDVRDQLSTAEAHILQGNGIDHQADIVLADANLFYCVSSDQLRELAFLLHRPARAGRHRYDHALVGSLHVWESRMDEEFIVLVLTDDDETVIHRRIHGFMKSEI